MPVHHLYLARHAEPDSNGALTERGHQPEQATASAAATISS
ncbi:hypothetical protein [Nocardioides ochotonae]|nr:hypothetical protein [Nocardioides ochotonae]